MTKLLHKIIKFAESNGKKQDLDYILSSLLAYVSGNNEKEYVTPAFPEYLVLFAQLGYEKIFKEYEAQLLNQIKDLKEFDLIKIKEKSAPLNLKFDEQINKFNQEIVVKVNQHNAPLVKQIAEIKAKNAPPTTIEIPSPTIPSTIVEIANEDKQLVSLYNAYAQNYRDSLQSIIVTSMGLYLLEDFSISEIQFNIAKKSEKIYGDIKLLCDDMVVKINSITIGEIATAANSTQYVWQTMEDDRVRPSHAANNQKIFDWDYPPEETGNPGHDYGCRCIPKFIPKA